VCGRPVFVLQCKLFLTWCVSALWPCCLLFLLCPGPGCVWWVTVCCSQGLVLAGDDEGMWRASVELPMGYPVQAKVGRWVGQGDAGRVWLQPQGSCKATRSLD
jgi:hypothetical protein